MERWLTHPNRLCPTQIVNSPYVIDGKKFPDRLNFLKDLRELRLGIANVGVAVDDLGDRPVRMGQLYLILSLFIYNHFVLPLASQENIREID